MDAVLFFAGLCRPVGIHPRSGINVGQKPDKYGCAAQIYEVFVDFSEELLRNALGKNDFAICWGRIEGSGDGGLCGHWS